MRNWWVFDSDPISIGPIAHLIARDARATVTAQCTSWSCHHTVRTQLCYWSQNCDLEILGSGGKTGPFPTVWVFGVVWPMATVRCPVELEPELTWEYGTVATTILTTEYFCTLLRSQYPVLLFLHIPPTGSPVPNTMVVVVAVVRNRLSHLNILQVHR